MFGVYWSGNPTIHDPNLKSQKSRLFILLDSPKAKKKAEKASQTMMDGEETSSPENMLHWVEGGSSPARLAVGLTKSKANVETVSIPQTADLSDLRTFAAGLKVEDALRRMEHGVHVMMGVDGEAKRKYVAVHPAISRLVFLNHKGQLRGLSLDKITKIERKPKVANRKAKVLTYLRKFPDYIGMTVAGQSTPWITVFRGPREMNDFMHVVVLLQKYYNLKPAVIPQ